MNLRQTQYETNMCAISIPQIGTDVVCEMYNLFWHFCVYCCGLQRMIQTLSLGWWRKYLLLVCWWSVVLSTSLGWSLTRVGYTVLSSHTFSTACLCDLVLNILTLNIQGSLEKEMWLPCLNKGHITFNKKKYNCFLPPLFPLQPFFFLQQTQVSQRADCFQVAWDA